MSKLKIATAQFAVTGSINRNATQISRYIEKAAKLKANIIHFSESALSGYAGIDFPNFTNYDWDLLDEQTKKIQQLAKKKNIYVVFGSAHKIKDSDKPHQSLYLVNPDGNIQARYDKRFCIKSELRRYTPGNKCITFNLNSVKCALLICFEIRFPEIYRDLYKKGVKCIFQSFYNARQKGPSVHTDIMQQSMQCRAASNAMWVSMSNSIAYYSPYASCFITPDGKIQKKLSRNKPGIMVNTLDTKQKFYDPMVGFRDIAINGKLTCK